MEDTSTSYSCNPGITCPVPTQTVGGLFDDEKVAKGELGGETYALHNTWLSKRRLYERITEEGNPDPENADITDFLEEAEDKGLAAYANMQTDMRPTLLFLSNRARPSGSEKITGTFCGRAAMRWLQRV